MSIWIYIWNQSFGDKLRLCWRNVYSRWYMYFFLRVCSLVLAPVLAQWRVIIRMRCDGMGCDGQEYASTHTLQISRTVRSDPLPTLFSLFSLSSFFSVLYLVISPYSLLLPLLISPSSRNWMRWCWRWRRDVVVIAENAVEIIIWQQNHTQFNCCITVTERGNWDKIAWL